VKRILISTCIAAALVAGPAAAAQAAPVKEFKNCTQVHKYYPHGVGKTHAKDKVRGSTAPVRNFKKSTKLYKLNMKSDRDNDGVACESR
jgi:hypothetical protein